MVAKLGFETIFKASIFSKGGCALFSLRRYKQGFEAAFIEEGNEDYHQSDPPFQSQSAGMIFIG